MPRSQQKMHMHPCMHAYASIQQLRSSCHGNYCELSYRANRASSKASRISLMDSEKYKQHTWFLVKRRAGCCLPQRSHASLMSRQNWSPDATCSRKHSTGKSTLAHDAVAAALSHKHHPIINIGAGPIQRVYASHSRLAAKLILDKNIFPPLISLWTCDSETIMNHAVKAVLSVKKKNFFHILLITAQRCDDTVDKKRVHSCVLKHLFWERVEQPKISPKKPGNAFSDVLLM